MKLATNWMTRLYQNGAELVNFTMEQSSCIDHLLGHIESRDNGNSMRYHATNCCCIHCQGTRSSEDHHLSVSVPPVFNSGHIGLLLPLEQAQMSTFHNRPHNYKKNTQFLLPSAIHFQRSTTTSTMASTSQANPAYVSTTSHMSSTLPPHPYHQTPPLPIKGNERRSSSSSRKSEPASRHSNDSSRWLMTTPPSSIRSLRTHQSTTMSTGEKSTGDQCHNGNNHHHCCKMNDISATQSASHSNCCTAYNPCVD